MPSYQGSWASVFAAEASRQAREDATTTTARLQALAASIAAWIAEQEAKHMGEQHNG